MQHFTQFNGYYGCSWCLHPGKTIDGTVKYPVNCVVRDRSMEGTKKKMHRAVATGEVIKGLKGVTPLINLAYFDVIWSFSPDYMHCVLLGVSRQLTECWLSNVGEPYYIGAPHCLSAVDGRLCSIRPHLCISRLPRSLSLRKYWKASEWQQWLLLFSLPCLEGILPRQYFKHFALLVQGIALLLQETVCSADVETSTACLVKFVVDVQFLYGERHMTYNVHQLLHIAKSVVNQGPLWAHSCFTFESNIGHLKELVTSAKGVPLQIVERLMLASNYKSLRTQASPRIQHFLSDTRTACTGGILLLSRPRDVSGPLLDFVQNQIGNINGPVVEHDRARVSGHMFHSEQYARPNKTNCTALVTNEGMCLKVKHIVSFKDLSGHPKVFVVSEDAFSSQLVHNSKHIMKCERTGSKNLVELVTNVIPCTYIEHDQNIFFIKHSLKVQSAS
ncbi:uncharacterized protein LOC144109415 [Amblyomma americanum]